MTTKFRTKAVKHDLVWQFSLLLINSFNITKAAIFLMQDAHHSDFSFFIYKFYLPQLVFSACVAAVKYRPVLHHCEVTFSAPLE